MKLEDKKIVEDLLQVIKGHWTEEMIEMLEFELNTMLIDKYFTDTIDDDLDEV